MPKLNHELRDGIHGFVHFNRLEKRLIDSEPFQRLRCIHQLAMSYQVYPGAVHNRFEHSLGVMQFAGRIFDTLFGGRVSDSVNDRISEQLEQKIYWRQVVRIAALLHDIGHLPFSHAAEKELLPEGWNHERLTVDMIRNSEIAEILQKSPPYINPEHVVDAAWDLKKRAKVESLTSDPWRQLLNEIICGDTFGADRIDYLLRDSWHAGVSYGRFDPDRLIAGLTCVIDPSNDEVALALDRSSVHAAEALLLARYFMYSQVYFHHVRRAYDIHLKEFLQKWLPDGRFDADSQKMLEITDHEVTAGMRKTLSEVDSPLHTLAKRVLARDHFRTVYSLNPAHKARVPDILDRVVKFAEDQFGTEGVRSDQYTQGSNPSDFLVVVGEDQTESSLVVSDVIAKTPSIDIGLVFVDRSHQKGAEKAIPDFLTKLISD
ncbi:MAG: HD domain-containing protein [Planctomycetaceae bacterium]|nr:HD domain-containing protein [Planctomycetaceae bacterium]